MHCTYILTLLLTLIPLLTHAAPANNSTIDSLACDPNNYGCSACSECCVLTYTTSPTGCGALGDPQTPLYGVAKPNGGCHNLAVGVRAAMVQECTGWFDTCVLWSEPDCWGVQARVGNVRGSCAGGFLVKSIGCIGEGVPDK